MQGEGRAMIGWKHTSSSGADINAAVLEDNLEELLLLPTQEQVQNTERQDNHRGHLPQLLDQQLSAMNDESSSYSLHQKQQVSSHLSSLPSSSSKILTHSYQYAPPLPWGDLSVIEREGPVQCIAPSLQGHTRLSDEVQLPLPSSNDLPFLNQSFCEACESRNHLNVDSMNEAAVICQPRRFFSPLNPGVALLVAGSPGATSSIATSSPSSIHQWGDQILLSTTTSSFSSFSKESEHYVGRATSREVPLTGAGKSLQDKDDIMLKMRSGSFVNASTKRVIDDVARAHLLSTSFPDHEGHKHPQKEVLEQIHAHLTATEWKNDKISPVLQPCLQPRADILSSSLSIATPLSKNLLESSDVTRISGSCIDMQAVHHNQFHNANQIEDDNLLAISLTSNQVDPDHPSTRSHDHKCGLQRSSQRLLSFGSSGQKTENRARGGNGKMTMVPCKARGMPKDHNMKVRKSLQKYLARITGA